MGIFGRQVRWLQVWTGIALLIPVMLVICTACWDNKVSEVRVKLEGHPQDSKKTSSAESAPTLSPPLCPPAGVQPLETSAPGTGNHKVFLRWNASKSSKDVGSDDVAYCLYRSISKEAAKKNPTCRNCEQINTIPVFGTACVDDVVKNGATYYYVVTAIGRNRALSLPSNEIIVPIPRNEHLVGRPPPGSYPLCRATPTQRPKASQ
jgi:hypothetical protein